MKNFGLAWNYCYRWMAPRRITMDVGYGAKYSPNYQSWTIFFSEPEPRGFTVLQYRRCTGGPIKVCMQQRPSANSTPPFTLHRCTPVSPLQAHTHHRRRRPCYPSPTECIVSISIPIRLHLACAACRVCVGVCVHASLSLSTNSRYVQAPVVCVRRSEVCCCCCCLVEPGPSPTRECLSARRQHQHHHHHQHHPASTSIKQSMVGIQHPTGA